MAITKKTGRQSLIVAEVDFAFGDLTDGAAVTAIAVPAGAVVVGGAVIIDTEFDSVTTDTLDVGDAVGPTVDRYLDGQDVKTAAGYFALVPTGYQYLADDTIDIVWNQTGGSTSAGAGRLIVEFYVDDRRDLTANGESRVTV